MTNFTPRLSSLLFCLFLCSCEQHPSTTVQVEEVDITIDASGELESKQRVYLGPPTVKRLWQYSIKSMLPENSFVQKDQIVLSFDDIKVMERLKNKQSKLAQAEKKLENKIRQETADEQELILIVAEKKMEYEKAYRKNTIVDHNSAEVERKKAQIDFKISDSDLTLAQKNLSFHQDNSALNINRAKAKVDRLKSEVKQLEDDMARLKVRAPIAGMVIYMADWNGEKPSVGGNINQGQSVIEIAVIDDMQIKAQVTEADSGNISLGQAVNITLGTAKDKVFHGTITQLGKVFREKSWQDKSKVFDIIIDIEKIDSQLMRPGMTARVAVISKHLKHALTIPQKSIHLEGDQISVHLATPFGKTTKTITVSHVVGNKVVVSEGLQAGEQILL